MTSDLSEVRASRLPLAFRCPGSVRPPKLSLSDDAYDARLGIAVHEVLRSLVETGAVAWSTVARAAEVHGVMANDVGFLCGMAQKLWPMIADSFRDALTEVSFTNEIAPGIMLTGHADAVALRETAARILDWKSGRKDTDYSQQMRGYAVLALLEDPVLTEATATIVWIRDQEIENYTVTRDAAAAWIGELYEKVLIWDGTFHPGSHCRYCPRAHECEAAHAMARRDVAVITDRELVARVESGLSDMSPEQIIDLNQRADMVVHLAERVRSAIKQHVQAFGDVVGGGLRLTIDVEERRVLDTRKTLPLVAEKLGGFESEALTGCLDISVTALEKAIAKQAGRGNGAGAVRLLKAELEAAGAVSIRERHYLKEKRA